METVASGTEAGRAAPLFRLAYGMGTVVRHTVRLATLPYHALVRLLRTSTRRPRRRRGVRDGGEGARVAEEEGFSALADVLANPNPRVRLRALEVICELSGARASRLLAGILHDPDPDVRVAAARAAAQIGARGAVFSLILALDDPHVEVAMAAAHAITSITGKAVRLDIDATETERLAKVQELKHWWKQRRLDELEVASEGQASP